MNGWEHRVGMPQRRPRGARAAALGNETAGSSSDPMQTQAASESADRGGNEAGQTGQMEARAELRSGAEAGASYECLRKSSSMSDPDKRQAGGDTLEQAFANTALAMLNYMTPLADIRVDESCSRSITVTGHDMHTLLFAFLDELLFLFSTEMLVFKHIRVESLDRTAWSLEATGQGERFDRKRHASGTEVKAITYSAMQITERTAAGDAEVFVIVDI